MRLRTVFQLVFFGCLIIVVWSALTLVTLAQILLGEPVQAWVWLFMVGSGAGMVALGIPLVVFVNAVASRSGGA